MHIICDLAGMHRPAHTYSMHICTLLRSRNSLVFINISICDDETPKSICCTVVFNKLPFYDSIRTDSVLPLTSLLVSVPMRSIRMHNKHYTHNYSLKLGMTVYSFSAAIVPPGQVSLGPLFLRCQRSSSPASPCLRLGHVWQRTARRLH